MVEVWRLMYERLLEAAPRREIIKTALIGAAMNAFLVVVWVQTLH